MSTSLSPSNADLTSTPIYSPYSLKSTGDALPIPYSQSETHMAAENIATWSGEDVNERAVREDTQDQWLSIYVEDETKEIKEDLPEHFEARDKKVPRTTSGKQLNDQV